jgi:hypothetical protein
MSQTAARSSRDEGELGEIEQIIGRRIGRAPLEIRRPLFPTWPLKTVFLKRQEYALVGLATRQGKKEADHRARALGHPYPGLITTDPNATPFFALGGVRNFVVHGIRFDATGLFKWGPDSTAIVKDAAIELSRLDQHAPVQEYQTGTVFVVTFGDLILPDRFTDALDETIARFVAWAATRIIDAAR